MEILKYPDSRLREEAFPVKTSTILTQDFRKKCWEMINEMKKSNGVGLAATQVAWDARVFVMLNQDGYVRIVINPEWRPASEEKWTPFEGCLSFPEDIARIERYKSIRLIYTDLTGTMRHDVFNGLDAQVIQHETDHLNGTLFLDYKPTVVVKRRFENAN